MAMKNKTFTPHPGIRIDRIPVDGTAGLFFTAASFLVFLTLPVIREFLLITLAGALPFAGFLYFWHNQTRW